MMELQTLLRRIVTRIRFGKSYYGDRVDPITTKTKTKTKIKQMKDSRKANIEKEVKELKDIHKEIKRIVDDPDMEPETANDELTVLNKKLETVFTNLDKI